MEGEGGEIRVAELEDWMGEKMIFEERVRRLKTRKEVGWLESEKHNRPEDEERSLYEEVMEMGSLRQKSAEES